MHVHVAGDARARAAAQIHADVQAIGAVGGAQVLFAVPRQAHHLQQRFLRQVLEPGDVLERHHHDVAIGVWKAVENDEIATGPVDDEVRPVVTASGSGAEDAP